VKALVVSKLADVSVELTPDVLSKRDALLAEAKSIAVVSDEWSLEEAVGHLRTLQGLVKSVEKSRTEVKSPVLDLGRAIDAKAKEFVSQVEAEATRINRLVTEYQAEQRRIAAAAESARQAELVRIEAEKRRAAEEQERLRREAEAAELKRQQELDKAEASFDETEESTAAAAAAEAAERKREAEAAAEAERLRLAQLEEQRRAAQSTVAAPAKVSGLVTKEVWKFDVEDIWVLARDNRDLVRIEPNTAAINEAIRGGMRGCPGLRIYSETKTEVRS